MNIKEIREWINTIIAFVGLIVFIIGTYSAITELKYITINLKKLEAEKVVTPILEIINGKYNTSAKIINNGSCIITKGSTAILSVC